MLVHRWDITRPPARISLLLLTDAALHLNIWNEYLQTRVQTRVQAACRVCNSVEAM